MPERYYVMIFGPSTAGAFGCDELAILSPADVTENNGVLIITTAPVEARTTPATDRCPARKIRARGPEQVIYPRGGWTKIRIGKARPRT